MPGAIQEPCHATHCCSPGRTSCAGTPLAVGQPVETGWTCPFCSLLCDSFALAGTASAPVLRGSDCPRALAGLAAHAGQETAGASIDGVLVPLEEALREAARRLAQWRQPLFGGLGTDVAGARALHRLAAATGAICDHADGEALMHGLRALQDRGLSYTTLAEIHARADMIVCVGTPAVARYPEFFRRCGLDRPATPCRQLVFLGAAPPDERLGAVQVRHLAGSADLLADLQQLAALVDSAHCPQADSELVALAAALRGTRYAVLVWEAGVLPRHGALVVETLNRIASTLNQTTRAATFGLGGSDGAYAVQQAFTWLSGLPLRTRGTQHDPVRFAAGRLLADNAVDGLLWVWSFGPDRLPPPTQLPRIVLGPPGMGTRLREAARCVFIPVATPGLGAAGHLFRTDGVVVPLVATRDDGLPNVERALAALLQGVAP